MNKCTCGNLGHGLCSSWCDSNTPALNPYLPTFDVSGTSYIYAVTDFTLRNFEAACNKFNLNKYWNDQFMVLSVSTHIYDAMMQHNMVSRYHNTGKLYYGYPPVQLFMDSSLLEITKGIYDSVITVPNHSYILRTREY